MTLAGVSVILRGAIISVGHEFKDSMGVCIFGSLNMDLVVRAPRLPNPGETLKGSQFETIPGSKGANQAVAVARLGFQACLFGRVGADGFGQQLIDCISSAT